MVQASTVQASTVQAVISSILAAACVALCLLMIRRRRRIQGSTGKPDGFGGIRAMPPAPLPELPTDGAATPAPVVAVLLERPTPPPAAPAVPSAVILSPVIPSAAARPVPMANAAVRGRNNGFSRFAEPARRPKAAAVRS